jgi:Initiator Replication protein, WH1/Initiator Rep protein, WH2
LLSINLLLYLNSYNINLMIMSKATSPTKVKIPNTLDEIMLIQPNNVTFGQYSLNPVQENILTLIMDALQNYMTVNKTIPKDLFNMPYVEINCDEAGGRNSKHQIKKAVKDMATKNFEFKWVHPEWKKNIETSGAIITTYHDVKATNKILINFNPWAVPFLVYYGRGVGGTRYSKSLALSLSGEFTKRIYKYICRWQDRGEFFMSIQDFRKDLDLLNTKSTEDNKYLKKYILEPAKKRIRESGSDVWFDYELICKNPIKGRKPKADTILFNIFNKKPVENKTDSEEAYRMTYFYLGMAFDSTKSSKAKDISDKLNEQQDLERFFERMSRLDDEMGKKGKTTKDMIPLIKHILIEDYNFEKKYIKGK